MNVIDPFTRFVWQMMKQLSKGPIGKAEKVSGFSEEQKDFYLCILEENDVIQISNGIITLALESNQISTAIQAPSFVNVHSSERYEML